MTSTILTLAYRFFFAFLFGAIGLARGMDGMWGRLAATASR